MRQTNTNMVAIDGERLKKAIEKRGTNIYEAGVAIDRSRSYIGSVIRTGRIHKAAIRDLSETFGIKLAEYAIIEKTEPAETKDELGELEEIIARGVLKALEEFKEEHGPEAIVKAMEKWRTER